MSADGYMHPPTKDAMPASMEAEQALLGCVLFDNGAHERVSETLRAEHFHEPFHGRVWARLDEGIRRGHLVDPILLAQALGTDPAFASMGGLSYLADLIDRAPPAHAAAEYGTVIRDLSQRREIIRIGGEMARSVRDHDITATDHIEAAEQALFGLAETGAAQGGFRNLEHFTALAVTLAAEAYGRDGGLSGISTGLTDLDQKLGGLHASDLIILAARPSMGKSALAVNIAFNVARKYAYEVQPDGSHKTKDGGIVGLFSLEMAGEQLSTRLLAERSGIPSDKIRRGDITAMDFALIRDAAAEIQSCPLYIDESPGLSLAKVCARARRMKRTSGLDLVIVDYLQLITTEGRQRAENRVQEVTLITQGLKGLAKELNVPVLALAQLSRNVENREDKRPQLSDLRESGSIEQDADVVMSIYREEYYLSRTEPAAESATYMGWLDRMNAARGVAEIIIGKQRHGPIGTVKLSYDENITKFGNLAREARFDPYTPRGDR